MCLFVQILEGQTVQCRWLTTYPEKWYTSYENKSPDSESPNQNPLQRQQAPLHCLYNLAGAQHEVPFWVELGQLGRTHP